MRVFSSSPILRRHDVFTLETTDGIYVTILGLINKTRTEENGFPFEVFRLFSVLCSDDVRESIIQLKLDLD